MIRRAFVMRLKPDSLAEYRRHHEKIWPELVAEIERSGIATITTFRRDQELFVVSEIADDAAWERLWSSDVHNRWAQLMRPLMQLADSGAVESIELEEIVHIGAGTANRPSVGTIETVEVAAAENEPAGASHVVKISGEAIIASIRRQPGRTSPAALLEDDFEPAFEMIDEPAMASGVKSTNGARVELQTVGATPPAALHVASPVPPAKRAHKMAARRAVKSASVAAKKPTGPSNESLAKRRKRNGAKKSVARKSAAKKPARRKKTRPATVPSPAKKKSVARKHR